MIALTLSALLYWSDADSGRLDKVPFRLHGVDAPETFRPKCEAERVKGYEAKARMIELTKDAREVVITHTYGTDRHGRLVVDILVDGANPAYQLLEEGHLRVWNYPEQARPDWCGEASNVKRPPA